MAAYVISQWHASNTPDNEGNLVNIRGRQPGIFNWILSILGVEPKVHLKVDSKHVRFEQGSIGGSSTLVSSYVQSHRQFMGIQNHEKKRWGFLLV